MESILEYEERGMERSELIDMKVLEKVAPMIRNVGHPLRLRILDYLSREDTARNVGQITSATGCCQASVSQQLRILKDQGILLCRRDGNFMLYEIADRSVLHILECIRYNSEMK
jgi:DNA-binding transcriptional ArsR family regulator